MANFSASAGVEPVQSRTSVSGGFTLPARPAAPVQQVPAGYQLVYRMGGPNYMYGLTPEFGARNGDGRTVPGQIYGNMRGSREGADMFGFFPTMFQSQPYATASQMYSPGLGVMPLIGYPSKYPHVVMGGYTDYGAPIANQAISMMLPLLMMGLYRQMFPPMMPQAPAAPAKASGGGGKSSGGGNGSGASDTTLAYNGGLLKPTGIPFIGPPPPEVRRFDDGTVPSGSPQAASSGARSANKSDSGKIAPVIREKFPYVDRLFQGAKLVPAAVKGAAANTFLPGEDSTHEALLRARDNPVAVPDNVRRAFGGR